MLPLKKIPAEIYFHSQVRYDFREQGVQNQIGH